MAIATLKNYVALHRNNPCIAINDLAKTADLKRVFPDLYRADHALVVTVSATS
jgi:peptide-methionine (S)-S-oxide reductase